jgi:hypothetical protein
MLTIVSVMKGIGRKEVVGVGGWPWFEKGRARPSRESRGGRKPKTEPLRRARRIGDIQYLCNCAIVVLKWRESKGGR